MNPDCRISQLCRSRSCGVDRDLRVEIQGIEQKRVRRYGLNSVWVQRVAWEVLHIVRDDLLDLTHDSGGENVPVIGIRER